MKKSLFENFNEKLVVSDGCWEWPGVTNGRYGRVYSGGKWHGAHRVSYENYVGPIPDGMVICHICDNTMCVRPSHLMAGTQLENLADMRLKDRHARGSRNGHAKLSEELVLKIRSEIASGKKQYLISEEMGVSQTTISEVKHRKVWSHA